MPLSSGFFKRIPNEEGRKVRRGCPIQNAQPSRLSLHGNATHTGPNRAALTAGEGVETEVTWEDQQNINLFGRLNNKFHELEDDIKAKKDMTDNLEDASNELILADDPEVRHLVGEVFTHLPVDEVDSKLESLKDVNAQELESLQEEKTEVIAKMVALKKILYGKFGDSINLED